MERLASQISDEAMQAILLHFHLSTNPTVFVDGTVSSVTLVSSCVNAIVDICQILDRC